MVAATQSVAMPTMLPQTPMLQPSTVTAGTPIILAPRIPTQQLANVTSLPSQAVLAAASHTPSVVPPANAASVPTSGLVYSYDAAYLQRMLNYSSAVEPSAIGKCLLVFILLLSLVFCCFQQVSDRHFHLLSCLHLDLSEIKSSNCP